VLPMGTALTVSGTAPEGWHLFTQVQADNGRRRAVSNSVEFTVGGPCRPPQSPVVFGGGVSNGWLHSNGCRLATRENTGFGITRELELQHEAGFHPLEVLRHATVNGAKVLGLDDRLGRIRPGFIAISSSSTVTRSKISG